MKLSVFTTITRPDERGDNWEDAIACYEELADELVVIDGSFSDKMFAFDTSVESFTIMSEWPKEFSWEFIGEQFQFGYHMTNGDWVIHADLDFLFHENDFQAIRRELESRPYAPAVSFYKYQFVVPDRYNLKSRLVLAVNKKVYGDRIKFNGGGDLCQPTLDGEELNLDQIPETGIPFYNYEHILKSKEQITDDVGRMDRAYKKRFGKFIYATDGRTAYEGWYHMVSGRFQKPSKKIALEDHPKYIQETIKNLKPENFGYNGFGLIEGRVYG